MNVRMLLRTALVSLVLLLVISGCAVNPVSGKQDFVLMSEDEEIATGKRVHQQVLKVYPPYNDANLQAYVNEIGKELADKSHRSDLVFHFTVVDSPQVNAFALPGGYIYITRGMLVYLNSEAELAGVLGHEIGHVTARHAVRMQSKSLLASVLASVFASSVNVAGASDLANVTGSAVLSGFGREFELEADKLGAEYLARLGYDPEEMLQVIELLKDQEEYEIKLAKEEGRRPRVYHGLFASHPSSDARLQEVVAAAKQYQATHERPENKDIYLSHIDGLVVGKSASQGVVRSRRFYHKQLDFFIEFPKGWKIENLPDRLVATNKTQSAQIIVTLTDLDKKQTPEEFIRNTLRQKKLQNGEIVGNDDFEGYTAITDSGKLQTRIAAIIDWQRLYIIAAQSKALHDQHDKEFLATIKSVRRLIGAERELAQAKRIKVITTSKGDSFATLAKHSNITRHAEDQLRLLNGMYPDGEPEVGQLMKIVR